MGATLKICHCLNTVLKITENINLIMGLSICKAKEKKCLLSMFYRTRGIFSYFLGAYTFFIIMIMVVISLSSIIILKVLSKGFRILTIA